MGGLARGDDILVGRLPVSTFVAGTVRFALAMASSWTAYLALWASYSPASAIFRRDGVELVVSAFVT